MGLLLHFLFILGVDEVFARMFDNFWAANSRFGVDPFIGFFSTNGVDPFNIFSTNGVDPFIFFSTNFSNNPFGRPVASVGVFALLAALELLRLLTFWMFGGVFRVISSSSESTSITVGDFAGVDFGVFWWRKKIFVIIFTINSKLLL